MITIIFYQQNSFVGLSGIDTDAIFIQMIAEFPEQLKNSIRAELKNSDGSIEAIALV